jgi:hypothetical protein
MLLVKHWLLSFSPKEKNQPEFVAQTESGIVPSRCAMMGYRLIAADAHWRTERVDGEMLILFIRYHDS